MLQLEAETRERGILPFGGFKRAPADLRQESAGAWERLLASRGKRTVTRHPSMSLRDLVDERERSRGVVILLLRECSFTEKKFVILVFYRDFRSSQIEKRMGLSEEEQKMLFLRIASKVRLTLSAIALGLA